MRRDLPSKVLECFVERAVGVQQWPFDDQTNDPFWKYGSNPRDYRWEATIQITPSRHSSHRTRQPYTYNGMDVKVGDYVASTDGVPLKIVCINSKTETSVVVILEDMHRLNTFRDPSRMGLGMFTVPSNAIIFELNENSTPVLDPLPASGVTAAFYPNVMSRFLDLDVDTNFFAKQVGHGFVAGQMISIGNAGYRLTDSDHPMVVGRISVVHDNDHFSYNPLQKVIDDLDYLPGNIGTVLYADPTNPGEVTTDEGTNAVMVKLRDYSQTSMRSTIPDATTSSGNELFVNGVVVSTSGTQEDLVNRVNESTGLHGIVASRRRMKVEVGTVPSLINTHYGEPLMAIDTGGFDRPSAKINGVTVTFNQITHGMKKYKQSYASVEDMADEINKAKIPNVVAKVNQNRLFLINLDGGSITIMNVSPDAHMHHFAGTNSCSGLDTFVGASSQYIIELVASDARPIDIANKVGDPMGDLGLYSVENGQKAAALYIEKGIRTASNTVVPNIQSRNALMPILGDQAYVIDKGDGEWGLYMFDSQNWVVLATEESAKVDAATFTVTLDSSTGKVVMGEIGDGRRVTSVVVTVIDPFDADAVLRVGDQDVADRLMSNDLVDLTVSGVYETRPTHSYSVDTNVIASITTSKGWGKVEVSLTYQ